MLLAVTSTATTEIDWPALRREAGERDAIISLLVLDGDRSVVLVPALTAAQAPSRFKKFGRGCQAHTSHGGKWPTSYSQRVRPSTHCRQHEWCCSADQLNRELLRRSSTMTPVSKLCRARWTRKREIVESLRHSEGSHL